MKKMSVSGVSVAVVACVFVVAILGTLLFGITVYKSVSASSDANQQARVCLGYVVSKIHGADEQDMVYVTDFCGLPALCIDEEFEDMLLHTMIYTYNGKLREISYLDGLEFSPEDGEAITDAVSLNFTEYNRMITIFLTDSEGNEISGTVYLRSGEVA